MLRFCARAVFYVLSHLADGTTPELGLDPLGNVVQKKLTTKLVSLQRP